VVVEALRFVGITTGDEFRRRLHPKETRSTIAAFARESGLAPGDVSHLAVSVIVACSKKRSVVVQDFPELVDDPALRAAFQVDQRRSQRKKRRG
jgi:hypothetical protein